MPPGGSERTRFQRRDDILCAAERVFARDGFAATTMDAIAREACMSKGGLYRHFPSKDDLFLTIVARTAAELDELLRDEGQRNPGNGYAALEICVARTVTFAREREGKVKLALDCPAVRDLVDPRSSALSGFDSAIGKLIELALEILCRGQEDGSIRSDVPAQALALSVWGAVVGTLQIERHVGSFVSRSMLPADEPSIDLAAVITSSARPRANGAG